ncbi:MAG: aldo/keto reductase, partial [Nanoarchaeota archaeon]
TMHAMNELVDQNLVRFIGVSNFSVADLQEAQKYSKHKIVANQIEYSLLAQEIGRFTRKMDSEIIPYCQQHGIKVIAWRPLAYGLLAKPGFPALDAIAKKYGKTQGQVALNWIISKNMLVLVKATKPEHIKENIGAMGWRLSEEDIVTLELGFEKWRRKYYSELLNK